MSDPVTSLNDLMEILTESELSSDTQIVVRMPSYLEGAGQADGEEIGVTRLEVDIGFGSEHSFLRFIVEPSVDTQTVTMADVLRLVEEATTIGDPVLEIELAPGLSDESWDGRHAVQALGAVRSTGEESRIVIGSEDVMLTQD